MSCKRLRRLQEQRDKFERRIALCRQDLIRPGMWQKPSIQKALKDALREAENQMQLIDHKINIAEARLVP